MRSEHPIAQTDTKIPSPYSLLVSYVFHMNHTPLQKEELYLQSNKYASLARAQMAQPSTVIFSGNMKYDKRKSNDQTRQPIKLKMKR